MLYNPTMLADDSPWQTWSGHFDCSEGICALENRISINSTPYLWFPVSMSKL